MKRLLRAIYDRYCLWRYGKTYTQVLKEEEERRVNEWIRQAVREFKEVDSSFNFGDR